MPMPWFLVLAACLGMFAATASGSTRSPFLLDMARDLGVSLPAVANLFGVTSTCWGVSSFLAGRASDRWGRGLFLVGAPLALAATSLGVAASSGYWSLVAWVGGAGLACGAFTAAAMAEVSLRVDNAQRGRALGWVMSGQSLTLLIGIPLAAWLGAHVGWRGVNTGIAALALLPAGMLWLHTRAPLPMAADAAASGAPRATLRQAMTGPVTRLFCALVLERISFGLSTFYYPAFLRTAYGLELEAIVLPLAAFAVGNIAGTLAGGQLADRFPYRRLSFAVPLLIAGGFAFAWFHWTPGLVTTAMLGVGFSLFNALSRPPLLAAMASVAPEVRGVIMGLNSSVASIGWLTAALLGGWLYAGVGFGGFGPLMLVLCVVAALIVLPDTRLRQRS